MTLLNQKTNYNKLLSNQKIGLLQMTLLNQKTETITNYSQIKR